MKVEMRKETRKEGDKSMEFEMGKQRKEWDVVELETGQERGNGRNLIYLVILT